MRLDWKAASIIAAAVLVAGGINSLSAQQQALLVRLLLGNAVVSASNPLPVTGTVTPSGTGDVNLKQVAGASVATGNGTAAGSLRVALPTDGTGVVGLNAGSNIVGRVGIDQTTPGTTNLVSAAQNGTWTVQPGNTANTTAWLVQLAGQSFTNITTNTDTNVKGSPGTLVGLVVNTVGTTSSVQLFNDADGTCSSGLIGTFATTAQVSLTINAAATVGICAKTAGGAAADITILWR